MRGYKRLNLIVDDYLNEEIIRYAKEKHLMISEVVRNILRKSIPGEAVKKTPEQTTKPTTEETHKVIPKIVPPEEEKKPKVLCPVCGKKVLNTRSHIYHKSDKIYNMGDAAHTEYYEKHYGELK